MDITKDSNSDLQAHSRLLAIMPFDRPYMILLVLHYNFVYLASFPRYCQLFSWI